MFQFCHLKTQQRYILRKEVNVSKRELTSLVDSLLDFLKIFDHASKCIQISLPKPKVQIGFTKAKKTISLLITLMISLNIQINRLSYRSRLQTTILASFLSKSLNYMAINWFSQQLLTLTIAKFTVSRRTDLTLQTSVKKLRANTICSAFSLDCHYNKSTIDLIRDVYCPRKSVWVNFAYTKRPFNLSAEAFINVRKVRLCGRYTVFFLKIKQFSFSYSLTKGFTFLKGVHNQFKMLFEKFIVLATIVSTERNANLLTVM